MTSPRSLPTSHCELSEREVTSPSNLKVVGALDNYFLAFVIFLVSCPKGQVEKYVNVETCIPPPQTMFVGEGGIIMAVTDIFVHILGWEWGT